MAAVPPVHESPVTTTDPVDVIPPVEAQIAAAETDPRDHWFSTDHLKGNLRQRTMKAGMVTMTSQGVKLLIRVGSTAIFARLLTPKEFGVVASVTVITGFVEMFKDAGLATAMIQADRVTHRQASTLFWINVAVAVVAGCIIAALAPAIVWFYKDERLLNITFALAATVAVGGLSVQYIAILRRRMEFGKLAVIELITMPTGIVIGVVMAWYGWSYWSLIGMTMAGPVVGAIVSYFMVPWRPGKPSKVQTVMGQVKLGLGLSGASVLGYTRETFARLLIGRYFGISDLGVFSRAQELIQLPLRQALPPITSVLVPALSRLQNDPVRYRAAFRRIFSLALLVTYPLMLMCIGCAREIVEVLLGGGEWMGAVPVLQGFGLLAISIVPTSLGGTALSTMGRSKELLTWNFYSLILTVICVLAAMPTGSIAWVAFAVGAGNLFLRTPGFFNMIAKATPLQLRDLWTPMLAFGGACIIGTIVAWLVARGMLSQGFTSVPRLAASLTLGVLVYSVIAYLLPSGREAIDELKGMVLSKLRKKKPSDA